MSAVHTYSWRRVPRRVAATAISGLVIGVPATGLLVHRADGQPVTTEVDAQRARVRALEADLVRVDRQHQQAADAYTAAEARVRRLTAQVATNRRRVVSTRTSIVASREHLSRRLVALYASGEPSFVEVLVGTGSLTSAVDQFDMLRHVAQRDKRLVDELRRQQTELVELGKRLKNDRAEAATIRDGAEERVMQLRALVSERRRLLSAAVDILGRIQASSQRAAAQRDAAQAAAASQPDASPQQLIDAGGAPPVANEAAPSAAADAQPVSSSSGDNIDAHLARIAQCESGGNPRAVSPSGQYRGKYQFSVDTWHGMGGQGDPAAAPEAEQDRIARRLYQSAGPGQWPVCSLR